MLKIIKERTPVTTTEYHIEFRYKTDPEAGFCFPALPCGKPDFASMTPEAKANYEACLTDESLTEAEFTKTTHTYVEPAVGQCACGREIVLDADYMGAVCCECGQWYNLFGQALVEPKYWEEDWYEDPGYNL